MSTYEAREVLARYLSGTELARRWDRSGLRGDGEWCRIKAELEDLLLGEFAVFYAGIYNSPDSGRIFTDSNAEGAPLGVGTARGLLLSVYPRVQP